MSPATLAYAPMRHASNGEASGFDRNRKDNIDAFMDLLFFSFVFRRNDRYKLPSSYPSLPKTHSGPIL
jgi:hypothetical protein